jgi:hypothetical protein
MNGEAALPMTRELTKTEISAAARLLVEYRLAREGVKVNRQAGHHLVASSGSGTTRTVEVYGNRGPKPAGGIGGPALAWKLNGDSPADLIAVADLSTDRVWLFGREEVYRLAQQHPASGGHHLIMVTHRDLTRSKHERILDADFADHLLPRKVDWLFGSKTLGS